VVFNFFVIVYNLLRNLSLDTVKNGQSKHKIYKVMEKLKDMEMEIRIKDYDIDFEKAKEIAKTLASNFGEAMMLSWCNYRKNEWYPVAECCGCDSWRIYAENRGANLKIKINDDYIFMFGVMREDFS